MEEAHISEYFTGPKPDRVHLAFDSICSQDSCASGEKPPVILLHGALNSKETWKKLLQPIADATGRKVYAYDARNHGDSGWSNSFSYGVLMEDLQQFMNCIHVKRAVLVGHSMGGKAAMYFALKWPERVEKLITEDISPKASSTDVRDLFSKYVHLLHRALEKIPENIGELSEAKSFAYKFIQNAGSLVEADSSSQSDSDSSILPLTQDKDGKFRWKANLDAIENNFKTGSLSSINMRAAYHGPTLFLWGTLSPYKVTDDREFILERFPGARFRAVEGASHQIHLPYEDLFLNEVTHFINEAR